MTTRTMTITRRDGSEHTVLYDEDDASLIESYHWRIDIYRGTHAEAVAGDKPRVVMHRLLVPGHEYIYHVNGNTLDNRRENLHGCTVAEMRRYRRRNWNTVSGYKGVSPGRNGRWLVQIKCNGKTYHLGEYDTAEHAALAYDLAAIQFHGEFARLNFPRVMA